MVIIDKNVVAPGRRSIESKSNWKQRFPFFLNVILNPEFLMSNENAGHQILYLHRTAKTKETQTINNYIGHNYRFHSNGIADKN